MIDGNTEGFAPLDQDGRPRPENDAVRVIESGDLVNGLPPVDSDISRGHFFGWHRLPAGEKSLITGWKPVPP